MDVRHGTREGDGRELENLFNLSLDLLCIATVDGYFKRVNPAFERTLGFTSEQLCSRPFLDFVHPEDMERTREAMAVLARGGELHQFENRYIRSDGSERWLQWNTRPVPGEGLVCAAARDVTDSREREEQAALRRVATLVARGAPPEELFAAVTEEAAQLLPVDFAGLGRYESEDTMVSLAIWGKAAGPLFDPGNRFALGGDNVTTIVARTGRSARIDSYGDDSGDVSVAVRATGIRSTIGTPIIVEGHLWGMMVAGTTREQPLPADTEARLVHRATRDGHRKR
jgi:PAS domain S-box-containing protein